MGLHDRIRGGTNGAAQLAENSDALAAHQPQTREVPADQRASDPYAELKTRVHHACIAKLGPQLYATETTSDLTEQVLRAVTEQLALDRTQSPSVDNPHLLRIIDKIVSQVGRRIDEASPMVDARLPDGSRVNAIIPPLSLRGPTMTIRKFSRDPYTMDDLISFGTITPKAAHFLSACVKGKLNVLIAGGTGTGKTTTLNALSAFVPGDE